MMHQQIANFRILRPLGGGASSDVFLAEESMTDGITRRVALKVLPMLLEGDESARKRFINEAQKLIELGDSGNPNIVRCFSCGIDQAKPWISMQVVERSLHQCMGDDPADPAKVAKMMRDVANGLYLMHERGLLHNDLKPANILVDDYGVYQLADFGLSGHLEANHTYGHETVRYAAPEVLSNEFGPPGFPTDLYSLGHIAYEMALGRSHMRRQFPHIFAGDASAQVILMRWLTWHTAAEGEVSPLCELLPDFPRPLSDLIERMMKKDPADRPSNAEEVLRALQALPAVGKAAAGKSHPPSQAIVTPDSTKRTFGAPHRADPVKGSIPPAGFVVRPAAAERKNPWREHRTLLMVVGVLLVLTVLAAALPSLLTKPSLRLDRKDGLFKTHEKLAGISGRVFDKPDDARLVLRLGSRQWEEVSLTPGKEGLSFRFTPRIDDLEMKSGAVLLVRGTEVLAEVAVRVQREPPVRVTVRIRTSPAAADAVISLRPAGAAVQEIRTDTAGEGEASVPYGKFSLALKHDRYELAPASSGSYDTGIEPSRVLDLTLRSRLLEWKLRLLPPNAVFELRDAEGNVVPVHPDGLGRATLQLRPGAYRYKASREGFKPVDRELKIDRGLENILVLQLQGSGDWQWTSLAGRRTGWLDMDAAKLAMFKDADFVAYLQDNAPLATLKIRPPAAGLKQVRIEGCVLSDQELQRLAGRLAAAKDRVVLDVEVNPNRVAAEMTEQLRDRGVANVQVLPQKNGKDRFVLQVNYDKSPGITRQNILDLCRHYVLDDALLDVRRPY